MQFLNLLFAPLCLMALLVAIHAYLGLHVLARDVIFVDICLSQVAALGAVLTHLITAKDEAWLAISVSIFLCMLVSGGLTLLRRHEKKISQEALIGISFALASGLCILVLDRLPDGAEHIKVSMIGNILFVTWSDVLSTAIVYAAVGALHFIFRKQFWASSTKASKGGGLWDFLFYFLFGVVITFSTHHVGILVVFTVLIAPACLAIRLTNGVRKQLFLAWLLGMLGVVGAMALSVRYDLPVGAGIVSTLAGGFFLVLASKIMQEKLS